MTEPTTQLSRAPARLQRFFKVMRPFLLGEVSSTLVEQALGPSPSGGAALQFYQTLVARNFHKILRDAYGGVRIVVQRTRPGLWTDLVMRYARSYERVHWDPNGFAEGFAPFVARSTLPRAIATLAVELADFSRACHLASVAPPDSCERWARRYTYPIPAFARDLEVDAAAPFPQPRATTAIVYRSQVTGEPRVLLPSLASLAALAVRDGLALPPTLQRIPADALTRADRQLIERGVVVGPARVASNPDESFTHPKVHP
jgi:hypothetical protein